MSHSRRGFRVIALLFALSCAAVAPPAISKDDYDKDGFWRHHGDEQFRIEILSGRPDTVAGGDALVRVTVRRNNVAANQIRIKLNGADVTSAFVANGAARTLTGLVTGMQLGRNLL